MKPLHYGRGTAPGAPYMVTAMICGADAGSVAGTVADVTCERCRAALRAEAADLAWLHPHPVADVSADPSATPGRGSMAAIRLLADYRLLADAVREWGSE